MARHSWNVSFGRPSICLISFVSAFTKSLSQNYLDFVICFRMPIGYKNLFGFYIIITNICFRVPIGYNNFPWISDFPWELEKRIDFDFLQVFYMRMMVWIEIRFALLTALIHSITSFHIKWHPALLHSLSLSPILKDSIFKGWTQPLWLKDSIFHAMFIGASLFRLIPARHKW